MKRLRLALAIAIGLVLCGTGPFAVAAPPSAAASGTACLDSASPTYKVDAAVVSGIARYGDRLKTFVFDGSSGVSERFFAYLSRTKCTIIMGYPVDLTQPDPPDGLALTQPYLQTAYVLATRKRLTQSQLRAGMTIAVGMSTAPHFYLAGAFGSVPNYTTDTFQTQEQALDALYGTSGRADAAMVWEPSIVRYSATHPAARSLTISPLTIQHARWKIAALYPENRAADMTKFNAALAKLEASGGLVSIVKPYDLETSAR